MKVGIVTFTEGYNYGNKLQNYALLSYLESQTGHTIVTVNNHVVQGNYIEQLRIFLIWLIPSKKHWTYWKRLFRFRRFNNTYLKLTSEKLTARSKRFDEVDFFICGSDQIWNPNYYESIDPLTGNLSNAKKSISYAASFGVDSIPDEKSNSFRKSLLNLRAISVREEKGLDICKIYGLDNTSVNIDPSFLLDKFQWEEVLRKPNKDIPDSYVLTYFLGRISSSNNKMIEKYCSENSCQRIDLNSTDHLDWFSITPFEFLYLIYKAKFIFTDSFHASVFSIIFNKKFLTSERLDTQKENQMNSRIDTLFKLFNCENHKMERSDENISDLYISEELVKDVIMKEKEKTNNYFKQYLY